MPAPIIAGILVLVRLVILALSVYEGLEVLNDLYDGLKAYNEGIEEAKKKLEELIKKLKEEIEQKIGEKEQVAILLAAAKADPQSEVTKRATGRGADGGTISAAIQQKIPFRKIISLICEHADKVPVLQLRKKKGVSVKDLPLTKRKALEELLKLSLEEIADVDLDNFIVVRLKQLATNLMFEFIDYCLDWASPMKCEVSFGPPPDYSDHPVEGGSATRLKRIGKISPFYPVPAPNNRKGSISADLVITEYRKQRCDKNNIFAIVEIKFEGDKIEAQQFKKYDDLLKKAAVVKTESSPVRFDNRKVSSGGRLSLFRFPEDKAVEKAEHEKKPKPKTTKKGRR
jgi:hypothetical protein